MLSRQPLHCGDMAKTSRRAKATGTRGTLTPREGSKAFVAFAVEQLHAVSGLRAKAMFGGVSLSADRPIVMPDRQVPAAVVEDADELVRRARQPVRVATSGVVRKDEALAPGDRFIATSAVRGAPVC